MKHEVILRLAQRKRKKNMVLVQLVQLVIVVRDHFHTNACLLDRVLQ
jgi:hypothetical protein